MKLRSLFKVRCHQLIALGFIILGVIVNFELACAQMVPREQFELRHRSNRNAPNGILAKDLQYKTEAVSLVFDLDSYDKNRIDVYIINDTDNDFRFERNTLDIPIVLEVNLGNGVWERAENRNDRSNYATTTANDHVLNRHHRKRKCRHWQDGQPAELRYSLYKNGQPVLVSDTFDGFLPMGKVYSSRRDLLAESLTPKELRVRYQEDETTFEQVRDDWLPKLTLLQKLGPAHIELEEIQKWTAYTHSNPVSTRAQRDLAIKLQTKMLQEWSPKYNLERLYEFCREAVSAREPSSQPFRHVCWRLLQDQVDERRELKHPELAQIAWQALQPSNTDALEVEKKAMARFLCSDIVAKMHSPLDSVSDPETFMQLDNSHIRIVTAYWFVSQKNRKSRFEVMDFYRSTSPESIDAYELVSVLHFNRIHNSYTKRNWDLWIRALELDSEYTISNLALMYEFDNRKFPKKSKVFDDELPSSVKSLLLQAAQEKPNTDTAQLAKKILDFSKKKSRSRNRFNLKF